MTVELGNPLKSDPVLYFRSPVRNRLTNLRRSQSTRSVAKQLLTGFMPLSKDAEERCKLYTGKTGAKESAKNGRILAFSIPNRLI